MPIIKDKYSAKGGNIRSKYVRKEFSNNTIQSELENANNIQSQSQLSTGQKQAEQTRNIKNIIKTSGEGVDLSRNTVQKHSSISGVVLSVADTVQNIAILSKGEILNDIIISYYNAATSETTVSMYWSTDPANELTFTTSSGIITAVEGGDIYRLFTEIMPSSSTMSLSNNGLFNSFNNISKNIYFYALSSATGTELTIIKK